MAVKGGTKWRSALLVYALGRALGRKRSHCMLLPGASPKLLRRSVLPEWMLRALFLQLRYAVPTLFLQFFALFLRCSGPAPPLHRFVVPDSKALPFHHRGMSAKCSGVLQEGAVAAFTPCCKCCQGESVPSHGGKALSGRESGK